MAERDEARRDTETIRSLVEELFREGLDCSAVAERVRTDKTLSDQLRHAGINLVLERCSAIYEQADSLIDDLDERLIFAADIREAVQSGPSLQPAVHAAAVNIARLIEDTPARLSRGAQRLVDDDDRSPADYERARRAAASAFRSDPASLEFTHTLARAWTRRKRPEKTFEVWHEHVEHLRAATPADDSGLAKAASELIKYGMTLLENDEAKDAEPVFRECVTIREKVLEKDNWLLANARSNLGECLAQLGRLTEAEPLLIDSAHALQGNDKTPENRKAEAVQRAVDLYEAWNAAEPGVGYDVRAAEWRTKLPTEQDAVASDPPADEKQEE